MMSSTDEDDRTSWVTVNLKVEGMMCQRNCGSTVRNALLSMEGAQEADAFFEEQRAYCVVRNSTYERAVEEAIDMVECVGFEASVLDDVDAHLATVESTRTSSLSSPMLPAEDIGATNLSDSEIAFQVAGMSCAVCTGRVETALQNAHPAIRNVSVVLAMARAVVDYDDVTNDRQEIANACEQAVRTAGYECNTLRTNMRENAEQLEQARIQELNSWRYLLLCSVSLTVPMFFIHRGNTMPFGTDWVPSSSLWVMWILSTVVQFGVGRRYYKAAWKGWINGRVMGMDFLVVLGTTASYVYSAILFVIQLLTQHATMMEPNFMTGGMLLTFVTMGKFLESYAKGKTASALQKLMELQPLCATRVTGVKGQLDAGVNMATLQTEEVDASEIQVGDYLLVLPGSRVPTDGTLVAVSGGNFEKPTSQSQAYIDESALSGEPFPVTKTIGDPVYGSTVNQLSPLLLKVTAVGGDTTLSQIVKLMEDAQRSKAPIQAYADKVACVFAPFVIALSLATLFCWLVFNSGISMEERFFMAFMSAISVVVVACPCALGLATPTAVMVGTGVGANQGLLIKGGAVLENMHLVDTVIFDKTGTLTTGRAVVGDRVQYLGSNYSLLQNIPDRIGDEYLALWLAACAELHSEHPLGKAIVNSAKAIWGGDVTCSSDGVTVSDFHIVPGAGVECRISKQNWGERWVRVGKKSWTCEGNVGEEECDDDVERLRTTGQVVVHVSVTESSIRKRTVVGILGVIDPIKKGSKATILALQSIGVDVWLCTGDHQLTASAIARDIGIDPENVCAGVSPEGKADLVSRLQKRRSMQQSLPGGRKGPHSIVAMVGDGINDSVALARADVGIAIGAGTEVAVEAADVVLVRSCLEDVVVALHLSRVVFRRIIVNFIWAMGYNLVALPFAAGILYPFTNYRLPPELAGLMMAFSSVSVVTNSLLLKNYHRPSIRSDGTLEGGEGILSKLESLFLSMSGKSWHLHGRYEDVPSSRNDELELV